MTHQKATFEVKNIFELPSLRAVVLQGVITSGMVVSHMTIKVGILDRLYMTASIKSVEYMDGPDGESAIGLVLDTPESEVREQWLERCVAGDVLQVDVAQVH